MIARQEESFYDIRVGVRHGWNHYSSHRTSPSVPHLSAQILQPKPEKVKILHAVGLIRKAYDNNRAVFTFMTTLYEEIQRTFNTHFAPSTLSDLHKNLLI
jgi:hypothetical protein